MKARFFVKPGRYSDGARCWDLWDGRDLYLAYNDEAEANAECARLNAGGAL